MHKAKRSKLITAKVTAHVTQEEQLRFAELAQRANVSVSEWCRRTLVGSLQVAPEARLIISELLGIRKIFLLLQIDAYEGKKLSEERLRFIVEQAEATKLAMADSRILSYQHER